MQKKIVKDKVGILTYHYAHNFGAALQAFAMLEFLKLNEYDAVIVNYRNKKICNRYKKELPFWFSARYRDWVLPWRWKNLLYSKYWRDYTLEEWKKQYKNFQNFQESYLNIDLQQKIKRKDIDKLHIDSFIFGSDQIWDTGITGRKETIYWGNIGKDSCKKIAYAASIYTKIMSKDEKRKAVKYLKKFDNLAVREESLANELSGLLDKKVEVVVDPTLLLSGEDYMRFIHKDMDNKKKYILVYMVSESEELIRVAKKIGMPIKLLHYYKNPKLNDHQIEEVVAAGPEDFLNLIYHAEYIITNSFHGTVFSILFQKKFCVVYKENVRIDNLLKALKMSGAHVSNSINFKMENILFANEINLKYLENYVENSKNYIITALLNG